MNAVVLFIAAGYLFPVAAALLLAALILLWWCEKSRWGVFLMVLGGLLLICSATPVHWGYYLILLIAAIGLCLPLRRRVWKAGFSAVWLSAVLLMAGLELRWWLDPGQINCRGKVYLVGDSISAGIGFPGEVIYAEILGDKVVNRSVGGGTVESALNTMNHFSCTPDDILFFEIGGNNMLRANASADFRQGLEALLQKGKATGAQMIMMELPLPPFFSGYSRAQRELAVKYGVKLIPKRHFAAALRGSESTADGLHLSNHGHWKMAAMFRRFIKI